MPLTVAVQMDPLESINIAGDSTFALMLSAQARGHKLFHYAAEDLNYADGHVWAQARPVTVQRVAGDHFKAEAPVRLDLGDDADVVLPHHCRLPPDGVGVRTDVLGDDEVAERFGCRITSPVRTAFDLARRPPTGGEELRGERIGGVEPWVGGDCGSSVGGGDEVDGVGRASERAVECAAGADGGGWRW